jgi:hypothetical protein
MSVQVQTARQKCVRQYRIHTALRFVSSYALFGLTVAPDTAFGCAPIVAPSGGWTQYNSLHPDRQYFEHHQPLQQQREDLVADTLATTTAAVVRCNETGESWHLLCRGTEWIGTVGNCSAGLASPDWS